MIGEFKISRASKSCHVGRRPLVPGEIYWSVLIPHDEDFDRIEIAAEHWTGPPENAIGWWKNRVPLPEEKKRELAPPEVMIELLRSMDGQPERAKSRYLLALLLLRKRHVKSETVANSETMVLEAPDGSKIEVATIEVSPEEAAAVQDELMELIYRDVE